MQLLELSLDMKILVPKITELNIWQLKFKSKSLTLLACLAFFSMYPPWICSNLHTLTISSREINNLNDFLADNKFTLFLRLKKLYFDETQNMLSKRFIPPNVQQ